MTTTTDNRLPTLDDAAITLRVYSQLDDSIEQILANALDRMSFDELIATHHAVSAEARRRLGVSHVQTAAMSLLVVRLRDEILRRCDEALA